MLEQPGNARIIEQARASWGGHARGGGPIIISNFKSDPIIDKPLAGVAVTQGPWKGNELTGYFSGLELSYDAQQLLFAATTDSDVWRIFRFNLADHIKVTGAALENGLLHIDLVREVPEALKPRQIKTQRWLQWADISPTGKRAVFEYRGEIITLPAKKGDARNLTQTLGLNVRAQRSKRIVLTPRDGADRPFGEVNVIRALDAERSRELLFFEHTWSDITQRDKTSIAFDNSEVYRSQRAPVNQRIREFANGVLPDPLAFVGDRGPDIRGSVGEAMCWALSARWEDLLPETKGVRCLDTDFYGSRVEVDNLVMATHSLGSRAAVDALQNAAGARDRMDFTPEQRQLGEQLQRKEITLFMLSNQLPLLEAGQAPQSVTGRRQEFCGDQAPLRDERFLRKLNMVAFSDPNDILSYPVPVSWADKYLESRLCADVRNVTINIAHVRRLPVIGEFADPLTAHTGYDGDDRVAELITHGIGHDDISDLVEQRCNWIELDPALD